MHIRPEAAAEHPLRGQRVLLHICCAPCSTFVIAHLRACGAQLSGYWYNPNIHPYSEHELRRESLARYVREVDLPVIWEADYDLPAFWRAIVGHERFRERCELCYGLRLSRAARVAAEQGFQWFSTTLLISPYQDIETIRSLGERIGQDHGVRFYYENLRRGYGERTRLAHEYRLYLQSYCGCLYSEWESLTRTKRRT